MPDELIFTGSDRTADRRISRLHRAGELRRLYAGIYTPNLAEPLDTLSLRHGLKIAGHLFPGAVLSGRTAYRRQPNTGN